MLSGTSKVMASPALRRNAVTSRSRRRCQAETASSTIVPVASAASTTWK